MGIKCPKCNHSDTRSSEPGRMHCHYCGHSWKPYKHRGKRIKVIGDGILYPIRRVIPGAKTKVIGDGIIFPKKRVKKVRSRRTSIFGI
jgi:hypothetical protein